MARAAGGIELSDCRCCYVQAFSSCKCCVCFASLFAQLALTTTTLVTSSTTTTDTSTGDFDNPNNHDTMDMITTASAVPSKRRHKDDDDSPAQRVTTTPTTPLTPTAPMAEVDQAQHSRLMRLPAELRNAIYEEVLEHDGVVRKTLSPQVRIEKWRYALGCRSSTNYCLPTASSHMQTNLPRSTEHPRR